MQCDGECLKKNTANMAIFKDLVCVDKNKMNYI